MKSQVSQKFISILVCSLILVLPLLSSCSGKAKETPEPNGQPITTEALFPGTDNSKDPGTDTAGPGAGTDAAKGGEAGNAPQDPESEEVFAWIDADGMTLDTRIKAPEGYTRIPSEPSGLTGFLRSLPLKEDGAPVMLYDGRQKPNQDCHVAVFDLEIGNRDLQQCADSIIRIYAEYYWSIEAYDQIAFHLTNGFLMEYTKWREGSRIVVDGNDVRWSKTAGYDDSYDTFRSYLNMVFAYAGTLSLSTECESIEPKDMRPGDLFLNGGSPGHCVLVADIAENESGSRCFLLAQGYMPAQDFHILKNPLHSEDPWYYADEISYPLETPQYTFPKGSLVRWGDFSTALLN